MPNLSVYPGRVDISYGQRQYSPPTPDRGEITGFSSKSRKRLIDRLAEYHRHPDYFVSLTTREKCYDAFEFKRMMHAAAQTIRRQCEALHVRLLYIWRVETHKDGSWHAHLVCWISGGPGNTQWRQWLDKSPAYPYFSDRQRALMRRGWRPGRRQSCWGLIGLVTHAWAQASGAISRCDEASIRRCVDASPVQNERTASAYVSKYLAKVESGAAASASEGGPVLTGRVWGCRGDTTAVIRSVGKHIRCERPTVSDRHMRKLWSDTGNAFGVDQESSRALKYTVYYSRRVGLRLISLHDRRSVHGTLTLSPIRLTRLILTFSRTPCTILSGTRSERCAEDSVHRRSSTTGARSPESRRANGGRASVDELTNH